MTRSETMYRASRSALQIDSPPLVADKHGVVRVGGSRVTLDTVISAYKMGFNAEDIVEDYDTLRLEDARFAIDYYNTHTLIVEKYLREGEEAAAHTRAKLDASGHQRGLRERLLKRRSNHRQ